MTINAFAMKKLEDFTVMQANEIVGHVRVKPRASDGQLNPYPAALK